MAIDILTQGFITFFDYTHVAHYFLLFTSVSSHFESKYKNMLFEVQIEVRSFMMCDHFLDNNRFIRSFLAPVTGWLAAAPITSWLPSPPPTAPRPHRHVGRCRNARCPYGPSATGQRLFLKSDTICPISLFFDSCFNFPNTKCASFYCPILSIFFPDS